MKEAIYIGGFCPLHRGHLDVIMRAKKENEHLSLIVYGYDDEPRAKELGLTTIERYRVIKRLFQYDEQINVQYMVYKEKPEWSKLIFDATFGRRREDVIFYTGEPVYHDFLINQGYNSVLVRPCINTSGTEIRLHPYNYMDYIAEPFRDCFRKVILITGASCEGKTTCARDLTLYFNAGRSIEYSRNYAEMNSLTLEQCCTVEYITKFMEAQILDTNFAMMRNELVFAESDAFTNLSYAKLLQEMGTLTEIEYKKLKKLAYCYQTIKYSKVFLFAPHKAFKDDNVRTMAAPFEVRKRQFEILKELYDEKGQEYEILSGTYLQKFETIKNSI